MKKIYQNPNRQEVDEMEREEDDEEQRKTFHLTLYNQDTFYIFCPGNIGKVRYIQLRLQCSLFYLNPISIKVNVNLFLRNFVN